MTYPIYNVIPVLPVSMPGASTGEVSRHDISDLQCYTCVICHVKLKFIQKAQNCSKCSYCSKIVQKLSHAQNCSK